MKKLVALTQADDEKRALATAMASHTASPEDHMQAVDQLAGKLVGLQIADSGQLQAALTRAVTLSWSVLILGIVLGIVIAMRISAGIVWPFIDAAQVAQNIAGGDLSNRINTGGPDEVGGMLNSLSAMQSNLAKLVANVRRGSEGVATASSEIARGNNDLSTRTEQQASALQETTASMEELGSTVKQNADSARQANQLAMSAAVEAARAGAQGRGFAVVASEVRSLAGRSAEAAKEFKSLIGASVERVERGTALVEEMAAAASSLKGRAQELVQLVAVFKLSADQNRAAPASYRAAAPVAARPSVRPQALAAHSVKQLPRR